MNNKVNGSDAKKDFEHQTSDPKYLDKGGFQLKFVSMSQVINHMTNYNSREQIL